MIGKRLNIADAYLKLKEMVTITPIEEIVSFPSPYVNMYGREFDMDHFNKWTDSFDELIHSTVSFFVNNKYEVDYNDLSKSHITDTDGENDKIIFCLYGDEIYLQQTVKPKLTDYIEKYWYFSSFPISSAMLKGFNTQISIKTKMEKLISLITNKLNDTKRELKLIRKLFNPQRIIIFGSKQLESRIDSIIREIVDESLKPITSIEVQIPLIPPEYSKYNHLIEPLCKSLVGKAGQGVKEIRSLSECSFVQFLDDIGQVKLKGLPKQISIAKDIIKKKTHHFFMLRT